jgi:hypothetical protein
MRQSAECKYFVSFHFLLTMNEYHIVKIPLKTCYSTCYSAPASCVVLDGSDLGKSYVTMTKFIHGFPQSPKRITR